MGADNDFNCMLQQSLGSHLNTFANFCKRAGPLDESSFTPASLHNDSWM
jgi:hypothetical protein